MSLIVFSFRFEIFSSPVAIFISSEIDKLIRYFASEKMIVLMSSESEDYPNLELPPCIAWTAEEVASWIEDLGFPHYKVINLS
ncbi:hypothetical protein NPIL_620391 [Nephila pilipes]|uniref:SAM domain-containing protein n=1 Tax=Nephila pilipes TaxID=299642 RepID=A0A8X6MPU2_NEPPI|nr:hypothetical protein NPIL_620391 [Nephila pilipes]